MCKILSITMYMNGIFAKEHCKMCAEHKTPNCFLNFTFQLLSYLFP